MKKKTKKRKNKPDLTTRNAKSYNKRFALLELHVAKLQLAINTLAAFMHPNFISQGDTETIFNLTELKELRKK